MKIKCTKVQALCWIATNVVMKKLFLLLVLLGFVSSCVAVKEYEKVYLNDPDMQLGAFSSERLETTFQVYREGAVGANGGKTGGGCGCN